MNISKEIEQYRSFYTLAVEETQDATYHVPVLQIVPFIEELLDLIPGWDLL